MPNDEDILAHPEQPRFLLSAWMWAVLLFVFFGLIVVIAFGAMPRGSTYEEDRAKTRAENLKTAHEEWDKIAKGYGWVDKDKGVAHIPIQRAMELELTNLQTKKPEPAGPIATPLPAEVPATTPAAAPGAPSDVPPVAPAVAPTSKPAATPQPPGGGQP